MSRVAQEQSLLPVLALRNAVLFPGIVVSFDVGRPKSVALAERLAKDKSTHVAVFTQKDGRLDDPTVSDLHSIGVMARVVGVARQNDGTWSVVLEGLERVRLESLPQTSPHLAGKVAPVASV